MRIISDFKDYYDSAQGFGSDPDLKYVRRQEQFEFVYTSLGGKEWTRRHLGEALHIPIEHAANLPRQICRLYKEGYPKDTFEIPVTPKIIGFCGSLYPAIEIDKITFYSTDQMSASLSNDYLKQFQIDQQVLEQLLSHKMDARQRGRYRWVRPLTHQVWETVVAELASRRFDDVFIQLAMPAFKVEFMARNKWNSPDKIRCTLDPHLKADQFQRVKDPFEAFQEISMYLGNELARQVDPVSIVPDDVLRDEKGFDKWSFRRHKDEAKERRAKKSKEHGTTS